MVQQNSEATFGDVPAVPGWASVGQAAAWEAACCLARRLQSRGVSVSQFYVLLDALLPRGWDTEVGIQLSDEESGRRLRELGFTASATAAILVVDLFPRADTSMAGVLRAAARPTVCERGCGRFANSSYPT